MKYVSTTFLFLVLFLALDYTTSLADVHVSYTTQDCVGVTTYRGIFFDSLGYSCENLPTKFNHVWVKQVDIYLIDAIIYVQFVVKERRDDTDSYSRNDPSDYQ